MNVTTVSCPKCTKNAQKFNFDGFDWTRCSSCKSMFRDAVEVPRCGCGDDWQPYHSGKGFVVCWECGKGLMRGRADAT